MVRLRSLIAAVAIATLAANSVASARDAAPLIGVGSQYDTTHVYVAPDDVDRFAASFTATFGGQSTKHASPRRFMMYN